MTTREKATDGEEVMGSAKEEEVMGSVKEEEV